MYKALIVDDEPLVREYFIANLSQVHPKWYASACASDSYQAIELLKNENFDVVITDICMPGMDGLELAKYIGDNCKDTYTIILSGHDEFDYARRAIRLDAIDYLLKPINDDEFERVLGQLAEKLEKREAETNSLTKLSPDSVSDQFRDYLTAVTDNTNDESVTLADRAVQYLYAHFCEPIALTDVAEELGVTAAYLSNVIRTVKGESYSKFLLRLRMERATLLLSTCPHIKIYTISEKVGYASSKHFFSVFKRYFGITPTEYRENN